MIENQEPIKKEKKKISRTKQCKRKATAFSILHFLCLFGPFLFFFPYAFIVGEVVSKVALSLVTIVSLILAVLSLLIDAKNRGGLSKSIMWLMISGVLFCLTEVKIFIWIMSITSILDELIFVRCRDHYKTAYIANKEIDKRS